MDKNYHKALLLILDGWGIGKGDSTDAVAAANTPVMDHLMATQPNTWLKTYGENVGLPEGQMGNSEVGHLNIGAGRIVYQMLVRINKAFAERSVLDEDGFQSFIIDCKNTEKNIHLIGLVSDGGVHSSAEHLKALCGLLQECGFDKRTYIHAFTDGRDCDPQSGAGFIDDLLSDNRFGACTISTVTGRYYAMDRDKRWERTKIAYDAMVHGLGTKVTDAKAGIKKSYADGVTDEFIKPMIITDRNGVAYPNIKDGDVVLCFNFRTDRGRQITSALTQESYHEQNMHPLDLAYYTFTAYDRKFKNVGVVFHNQDLKITLGEHLENVGRTQLRAAETEKYPHVTFFFSGGREAEFKGENRIMIPSPKVATYDLQPEMSALLLNAAIVESIASEKNDFMVVNFANPDMVGHTGVFEAILKACETVDYCVGQIIDSCNKHGYKVMIIADHGNADLALNPDGSPNTAHSLNPVPCIVLGEGKINLHQGILADVAPTLLKMMHIAQPKEMTGQPLY